VARVFPGGHARLTFGRRPPRSACLPSGAGACCPARRPRLRPPLRTQSPGRASRPSLCKASPATVAQGFLCDEATTTSNACREARGPPMALACVRPRVRVLGPLVVVLVPVLPLARRPLRAVARRPAARISVKQRSTPRRLHPKEGPGPLRACADPRTSSRGQGARGCRAQCRRSR
jgi:hypothetical protein